MTVTEVSLPPEAVTFTGSPAGTRSPSGVTVTVTGRSSALGFSLTPGAPGEPLDEQAASGASRAATTAARTRAWASARVRGSTRGRDNGTSGKEENRVGESAMS